MGVALGEYRREHATSDTIRCAAQSEIVHTAYGSSEEISQDGLIDDEASEVDSDEDEEEDDEELDGTQEDTDDTDIDGEEADEDDPANGQEDIKAMMAQTRSTAASQAARQDVEKGAAIRHQRKTFDSLLNARVKLQQALITSNTLPTLEIDDVSANTEGFDKAEAALGRLLETMDELRLTVADQQTGSKRLNV